MGRLHQTQIAIASVPRGVACESRLIKNWKWEGLSQWEGLSNCYKIVTPIFWTGLLPSHTMHA